MRNSSTLFLLASICVFIAVPCLGDVIYVDDDAPGPGHDGNSWQTAYLDLQEALEEAVWGDDIWVAAGVYKPSQLAYPEEPRTAHYCLRNGVAVYGGFAGTEYPASFDLDDRDFEINETTLTGDLNDNGRDPNDCYHVFYHPEGINLDPNAILDGFTITGGNANGPDPTYNSPHNDGGGIYNYQSSPVITNCKFIDNYAKASDTNYGFGGGIYNEQSNPLISNCSFNNNTASSGAAICNYESEPEIDRCVFEDNHASGNGGAIKMSGSTTVTNCIFTANIAYGGGAIYTGGSPYIGNCIFENNRAYGGSSEPFAGPVPCGGGILTWDSDCTIVNCKFVGNSVINGDLASGGGMCNYRGGTQTILNCVFAGNKVRGNSDDYSRGGGFYNRTADVALINCVFTGNSASAREDYYGYNAGGYGGGIYNLGGNVTLTNCTLAGNWVGVYGLGGAIYNYTNSLTITNSIIWWNYVLAFYEQLVTIAKPHNSFVNDGGTLDISYSNIFGCGGSDNWNSGFGNDLGGNIDEVPEFIDADGSDDIFGTEDDNVVLLPTSPCIDAGDNTALPVDVLTDVLGNGRFFDDPNTVDTGNGSAPIVDMGACEYDGSWEEPEGSIIYADDDAEGENDGSSWENAFNDLQDALDAAGFGDEIWVAKGTYIPSERIVPYDSTSAVFRLSCGVKLLGGFAGTEDPETFDPDERNFEENETILNGEGYIKNLLYNDVSLALNRTAVVDGFIISVAYRSAVYNEVSSPTIRNCTFRGNGEWSSPAVHNYYSAPMVTKCQFIDNMVMGVSGFPDADFGGTIYNRYSQALIEECTFIGNIHYGPGSAVFSDYWDGNSYRLSDRAPKIVNCLFIGNSSDQNGGAIRSHGCNVDILNCSFKTNAASYSAGAIYNATSTINVANCTFEDNQSGSGGGGICLCRTTCQLSNSILWDNIAPEDTGPQIALWGENIISIDYCDVQGGQEEIPVDETSALDWGLGNIDADPLFASEDNLRLSLGSPCIDAGDNAAVPGDIATDVQGWERVIDDPHAVDTGNGDAPVVDMGAYERDHRDINSDGRFNLEDMAVISSHWLTSDCGACEGANLNTDVEVNLDDVVLLIDMWLQ